MSETAHPPTPIDRLDDHGDEIDQEILRDARRRIEAHDEWQYTGHAPRSVAAAAVYLESGPLLTQKQACSLFDVSPVSLRNARVLLGGQPDQRFDTTREVENGGGDGPE